MELARSTRANVNITAEAVLLDYAYTDDVQKEVVARVDLGVGSRPIAGGGNYVLRVYLNGAPVSPDSSVTVASGVTETVMVSRQIPIEPQDDIRVTVVGLGGDTGVNTVVTLRDVTPLRAAEISGGGTVAVDHNYGGADALAVETPAGAKVDDATIRAYRRADYAAGNYGAAFVVATAVTDVNGEWAAPMLLDPGDYTLLIYKQGVIMARAVNLTVL